MSVGLPGDGRDGMPEPDSVGRLEDRSVAHFYLPTSSGLRRTEDALLLTLEVPVQHLKVNWDCAMTSSPPMEHLGPPRNRPSRPQTRLASPILSSPLAPRRTLANDDTMLHDNPQRLLLRHDGDVKEIPNLNHRARPQPHRPHRPARNPPRMYRAPQDQTTHTADPSGYQLRNTAGSLRTYANTHDQTRITTDKDTYGSST